MREKLEDIIKEQTEKIDDFATNQEQKLVSLLNGYEEHARGLQAKLLTIFHTDLTATYKDTARTERHNNQAIPVDEEEISGQAPNSDIKSIIQEPETHSPPKVSRWANVNQAAIRAGHSTSATQANDIPTDNRYQAVLEEPQEKLPRTDTHQSPSQYPTADYQQLARLRAATTPNQLRGRDRKSVCGRIFYNPFVDFNRIYRIPLKILDDIRLDRLDQEEENVYPTELREKEPQLYDDYISAIYARLEEDGVLDPNIPLY